MDASETATQIREAVLDGDLAELSEIRRRVGNDAELKRICDYYCHFCTGLTALHNASETGHLPICKFLIQTVKVHLDAITYWEDTPLMVAVEKEHLEIVKYLIGEGARVQMSNAKGFTALHYAVLKDNIELMQLLVSNGAPIEADSVDGTPLQCAASRGNVDSVKLLLHHGAEPNAISYVFGSPLICAIKSHSLECIELLFEAQADPNKFLYGLSPLAHAVKEGDAQILNSLLNAGADPNISSTEDLKPIEIAALARNLEVVGILIPLTEPIPYCTSWSVDGIMEYCQSDVYKNMREVMWSLLLERRDTSGKGAVRRGDYSTAIKQYSEATYLDPRNAKWVSNRSLCYERVGRGVLALRDAMESVRLDPECPKHHYRVGCAWRLFKNYDMAARAFAEASRLAPHNEEILNRYRVALFEYYSWMYVRCPVEMLDFFQRFF